MEKDKITEKQFMIGVVCFLLVGMIVGFTFIALDETAGTRYAKKQLKYLQR